MWNRLVIVLTVVSWAAVCAGQEAASQPTSRAAPTNQQRLNDLLAVIEGPNPPEARRTIARELLLQGWSETPARLVTVLGGTNAAAKVAVAGALVDLPQFLDAAYVEPLMGMLVGDDAAVRQAAAGALAAYHNSGVAPRLRQLALDSSQATQKRAAAVAALGLMTSRASVDALVEVLADPDPGLVQAALAAVEQATAMDFHGEKAAALQWWEANRGLSLEAWQQRQIQRLVHKYREARTQAEAVEARLAQVFEGNYRRASEAERVSIVGACLSDNSRAIRMLGLKLSQMHLADGKSLPAEQGDRVRELLSSPDPREQAAAVRTVASFRDPADGARFLEMLSTASNLDVRLSLLNGLGYVGDAKAIEALLKVVDVTDEASATEAVTALGRLAERGVLGDGPRDAVATALAKVFAAAGASQVALRERVLWAMSTVADPRFGPAFAAALDQREAVAVRQAAARGIAALRDPALADALVGAASDPDPGVRRTALETLAILGSNEKHFNALWGCLASAQESDEATQQAAWRGTLDMLSRATSENAESWLTKLPGDGERTLGLLQRLAQIVGEGKPPDRGRLGIIRARVATQHLRLGQSAEAVAEYCRALADLHSTKAGATPRVARELLGCALAEGRYDEQVAAALGVGPPAPDAATLWAAIKTEVEKRLTKEGVDAALSILEAVERHPPGAWPAGVPEQIKQLRAQAVRIKAPPPESQPVSTAPASQPVTKTPASQPVSTAPASQPSGG